MNENDVSKKFNEFAGKAVQITETECKMETRRGL
jgi:hypothetical protein